MSTDKRPDDQYPVLLIHEGKYGNRYIVAMNNEEEELAWLAMFTAMRVLDYTYCQHELGDGQLVWFKKACDGDAAAAQALLRSREGHKYENAYNVCIDTPRTMLEELKDE